MKIVSLTRSHIVFLLFGFLALSISGCAKYKPHAFKAPKTVCIEKDNVKVSATLLTEKDCQHYFGKKIIKKGYQPVQLYVENNSSEKFVLDGADIEMPIEQRDSVANALHAKKADYRATGLIVGSALGFPWIVPGVAFIVRSIPAHAAWAGVTLVLGTFLITMGVIFFLVPELSALCAWKMAKKADMALDRDFANRIFDKCSVVSVQPHTTLNTVFFVRSEYVDVHHTFTLSLYDATRTKQVSFTCYLA